MKHLYGSRLVMRTLLVMLISAAAVVVWVTNGRGNTDRLRIENKARSLTVESVADLRETQDKKSRVVEEEHYEGPVEIVGLSLEGRTANFLEEITAGKDWLKSLTLHIKNNYNKSIVYMEVELEIAKTGKMEYPLRLPITFGQMPSTTEENQPLKILKKVTPNSITEMSLSESTYNFLTNFMRENEIDDIDKVEVIIEFVLFDGDTAWSKGHMMRRDPNNPNNWIVNGVWRNEGAYFFKLLITSREIIYHPLNVRTLFQPISHSIP